MGWSYACDTSHDKKALIAKLTASTSLSPGYTMLRSMIVGNNHWYTYSCPDGSVSIGLNLMAGGGKSMGWGYKGISEDMGPYEKNCPLSLLDACTEPQGHAIEWRQKVREYHAAKKSRPVAAVGSVIRYGGHDYTLTSRCSNPRQGWHIKRLSDGACYRLTLARLAQSTLTNENPDYPQPQHCGDCRSEL